jgi:tetratricopeptide (TPR) repeat protein
LVLFLAIVSCLAVTGCTCLRRDKVDANVVSARQLSLRGVDAMRHDRWEDAEGLFADALRKNPADERAHQHLASVLWRRGEHRTAIQHQRESVRLSGGDPALLVELGEMCLKQGDLAEASRCAEDAIEANNQLSTAWALRGDIHRWRAEPNEAVESYHRALNYQPHYPHVQMALADLYRRAERPRRALATLESLASHYSPESVPLEVEHQRGLSLKSLGRFQDAVEVLTRAAQRGEPSPDLLCDLSEAQFLAGYTASARLALQAALAASPQHPAALRLKDKLERQGQPMTAAVDWK